MKKFKHQFTQFIPENLEGSVLYISMEFNTVSHLCACGCKSEVVTPLSPSDWKLTYNGEGVTLYPSVGSWDLPCQSHYWIKNSEIQWAPKWSKEQIEQNRFNQRKQGKKSFWSKFNI